MKNMKMVVAIALIGTLALTAGIVSAAQLDILGRVESVDVSAGEIVAWNGQRGEYTIQVDDDTQLTIGGAEGSIEDIVIPSRISGTVDEGSDGEFTGVELVVDSTNCPSDGSCLRIGGRITEIDVASRTVKLFNRRGGDMTVVLTADVKLSEDGQTIGITELEVGDVARFPTAQAQDDGTYLADEGSINDTHAGGGQGEGPGGKRGNDRPEPPKDGSGGKGGSKGSRGPGDGSGTCINP